MGSQHQKAAIGLWLVVASCGGLTPLLAREDRIAAMTDPAYHRHVMFSRQDALVEKAMGQPLQEHERQARLPWPQAEIIRRVERAIAERSGDVISILMARQSGKNECEGFLEARALSIWRALPGSSWVRMAPTLKPQLVNSKLRLEKHLLHDPLLRGRWSKREGYIYESGAAQIQFLSAGPNANVVGATASIALSVDEAHKIDKGKFDEDLAPFTASTNAPTILWGVAADKLDMLHEHRESAAGTDRVLAYPASVWCELSPAYAGHYESRVRELGSEDHPTILTQYRLIPVESQGAFLNDIRRAALFAGDHPRLEAPRAGMAYGIVIDIGGESEQELDDAELRQVEPERDYTMAWILEWDPRQKIGVDGKRDIRVVNGIWWVGKSHMAVLPELVDLCLKWGVRGGVSDARGVGEAVAMALEKKIPAVKAYKASTEDVSQDCYAALAWIDCGRLKFWKGNPAADEQLREVQAQARHTRYQIRGHQQMRLAKPTGAHTRGLHIDGVKALTYMHRAVEISGADAYQMFLERRLEAQKADRERAEQEDS